MSKIAFIFPGQGAQTTGMGQDFYQETETGREMFEKASEILGFSMTDLCFDPAQTDRLNITEYTQPAMVTASLAMMRVFMAILCSLLAVCSVSARNRRHEGTDGQAAIYRLPPFERAVRCTKYFEGWHSEKHHPYVGYGHRLQPGERYSARTMTKRQADALLRKDLRKFCAMFQQFGKDSLILSEISDNKSYPNQNIIPT